MGTQADRVQILLDLTTELQKCGTFYLATLLVERAYSHACLANAVFGDNSLDAAALEVNAQLRRMVFAEAVPAEPPSRMRRKPPSRRRVAKVAELLRRVESSVGRPDVVGRAK